MTEYLDINSESMRGIRVVCEDCREEPGSVLWKVLYLALRQPKCQNTKGEKLLAKSTADWHEQQTGHRVQIWNLKKLGPH